MALYLISFAEHGGYRYQCRIRAATGADHITLAVQKIWGAQCYWTWEAGSDTDGRVYQRVGPEPDLDDIPRTGWTTVRLTPARRRPPVG
jgi:hypothetical protein